MSKEILCCNGFTLLSTVIGLENFPSLSQPIRCELVTCLFPRFAQFVCFYFEFSLAHCDWLQSKLLSKVKRMIVRMRKFVKRIGTKAWGFNNFHGKTSLVAKRKALSTGQKYIQWIALSDLRTIGACSYNNDNNKFNTYIAQNSL